MSSSNIKKFFPPTIGSVAYEIITKDRDGIVHGITSRGLFIKTDSNRILYLASDPFKGPLTVNLDKYPSFLQKISPGTPVFLNPGKILIPVAGLEFTYKNSMVWEGALPSAQIHPGHEQVRRLKSLGEQILRVGKKTGLSWLLPYLFETPGISPPAEAGKKRQIAVALNLRVNLREADISALSSGLSEFLGRGPGLTPSGDDFVLGVMLCLNRWKDAHLQENSLNSLNQEVVETAYRLTTTLSANLIQSAALGLADERLLRALDWIINDIPDSGHLADGLLEWGHSSGVDVFTGIASVLSASVYSSDFS